MRCVLAGHSRTTQVRCSIVRRQFDSTTASTIKLIHSSGTTAQPLTCIIISPFKNKCLGGAEISLNNHRRLVMVYYEICQHMINLTGFCSTSGAEGRLRILFVAMCSRSISLFILIRGGTGMVQSIDLCESHASLSFDVGCAYSSDSSSHDTVSVLFSLN